MILSTERLTLRELTESDFDALYTVLDDSDIRCHPPYTFDGARVLTWIRKNIERYRIFGFGLWAVCLRPEGNLIGDCGLTLQRAGSVLLPEIGYHFRSDARGHSYAKEASCAVRDWTFRNTPFCAVYSLIQENNLPSVRTARSYGARLTETLTDAGDERVCVYALTREEWAALT